MMTMIVMRYNHKTINQGFLWCIRLLKVRKDEKRIKSWTTLRCSENDNNYFFPCRLFLGLRTIIRSHYSSQDFDRQDTLLGSVFTSGVWALPVSALAFLGVFREDVLNLISKIKFLYNLDFFIALWQNVARGAFSNVFYKFLATTTTTTAAPTTSFGNYK